jgi:SAM-dependent methyltransferase
MARPPVFRLLHTVLGAVDHAYRAFDVVRSEALVALVPPEDRGALTLASYDRNALFRSPEHERRVFPWEREAVRRFFPPAPARVLVGGAGSGREVLWLTSLGYEVAAFEPAPALARLAALRASEQVLSCVTAGYEDLVSGIPEIRRHAPYAAVVLGWGSLSHVADPRARNALFERVRALAPDGPVLLSWIPPKPSGPRREKLRAVLRGFGLRARLPNDSYQAHLGFIHSFDEAELALLARGAGYVIADIDAADPHAVLVPEPEKRA